MVAEVLWVKGGHEAWKATCSAPSWSHALGRGGERKQEGRGIKQTDVVLSFSLQVQETRGILDSEVLVTSCIVVWGVPSGKNFQTWMSLYVVLVSRMEILSISICFGGSPVLSSICSLE